MRLFIFHPLSGSVRDLHRFLLTRCAVVVLTGLGGFGGRFVEGDLVEQTPAVSEGVTLPAPATEGSAAAEPRRSAWGFGGVTPRAWQSVGRSARGEAAPLEVALLDAPLSDGPLGAAP